MKSSSENGSGSPEGPKALSRRTEGKDLGKHDFQKFEAQDLFYPVDGSLLGGITLRLLRL